MRLLSLLLPLCAFAFSTVSAAADARSTLIGTVIDAQSRQPMPGVQVTISSVGKTEESVVTDAQGNYRVSGLTPGVYTVRFEGEGFRFYARSDVQVRPNRTIRVNAELLPTAFEVVEMVGRPPTIDTSPGCMPIDQEFIKRIAVTPPAPARRSRPFEPLGHLVPAP
jgi:hypothetical protein